MSSSINAKPRLIGLYSPHPACGKTTVAHQLSEHGFHILPFAAALKNMVRTFLQELGLTASEIDHYMTTNKEALLPHNNVNVSVRHLCQTLGTEWGRSCIHPDVWMLLWEKKVMNNFSRGIDVVVDDVRFPNEAATILRLGGEMWIIERPGLSPHLHSHSSEGGLTHFPFSRRLINGGSLTHLYRQVELHLNSLCPQEVSLT